MNRVVRAGLIWMLIAGCGILGYTLSARGGLFGRNKEPDRGLKSAHDVHTEQGLDCSTCHSWEQTEHIMPGHDLCSICHEIDLETEDKSECNFCHTRPDQSVDPLIKRFSTEIIFEHSDHIEAEMDCIECHVKPGIIPSLPEGRLMNWCMECHAQEPSQTLEDGTVDTSIPDNECTVCHKELTLETRPEFRGAARIAHDEPEIWMEMHGHESQFDPMYCSYCHDTVAKCDDCHSRTKPQSHTVAWRRKAHGLRASWDRNQCAVCHEEEYCVKCHQNTEPASHRGGWDSPVNRHCVSCHYPPQENDCVTCHENIDHRSAMPSPHNFGVFPANCAICHPGGLPHRAPHALNSTVRCAVCHK